MPHPAPCLNCRAVMMIPDENTVIVCTACGEAMYLENGVLRELTKEEREHPALKAALEKLTPMLASLDKAQKAQWN